MASSASHMIIVILLALAVSSTLFSPAASTSRSLDRRPEKNGFRVSLRHVDSGGNYTKFERLQRAVKRGRLRLQRLSAKTASFEPSVEAPVHAGNGEFLMNLAIGTPAETYSAIMDTGSDLIWTQCKPCKVCFDQPTPIFDPEKSSSFSKLPCSSDLCVALPISSCSDGCEYRYSYGDHSSTQGVLATETFTFGDASVSKIGFGCGEDNRGRAYSQGQGCKGISTLLVGSEATVKSAIPTPLIQNPSRPSFYYLSLEGISVGDTLLPIEKSTFSIQDDGSGGLIIDSGTTITYLKDNAFAALKKEFISQMKLDVDASGSTELELCFTLPPDGSPVEVPQLVFHFEGVDLKLPKENYIIEDSALRVICLTMGSSSGDVDIWEFSAAEHRGAA
ncbi:Aspartic proteinase nepenthesin-1 [Vitis vinifera]|uniref:Aspartic proteinase nepenthesin-1 n=1 Tax=Vitis vinifera TaxID=29760 RepID=A0A438CN22_VITVI|nr:Aspartic proteinase nepenthesin-1 [Vitis vinifera]